MGYRTPPPPMTGPQWVVIAEDETSTMIETAFTGLLVGDEQDYPELAGGNASVLAWEAAAARSRQRSAERHAHDHRASYLRGLAAVYGAIFAGAVILADLGGLPGLL